MNSYGGNAQGDWWVTTQDSSKLRLSNCVFPGPPSTNHIVEDAESNITIQDVILIPSNWSKEQIIQWATKEEI